jgi:hypothetical protein
VVFFFTSGKQANTGWRRFASQEADIMVIQAVLKKLVCLSKGEYTENIA